MKNEVEFDVPTILRREVKVTVTAKRVRWAKFRITFSKPFFLLAAWIAGIPDVRFENK